MLRLATYLPKYLTNILILTSICGKRYKICIQNSNHYNFHVDLEKSEHIQQHKILSSEYLNNNSEIRKWIKCFKLFIYLPFDEVSDIFYDLMSIAPSPKSSTISIFSDYILEKMCVHELYLY
ncbi:MULE domain-containing protein [Aphis craccivora]|uniref:MULE domain-containing protein n=1 Tax=Aphis craccivora TaxID=307492 RepID=A0A6G0YA98_APHCR|nr:MULE domain-containing protein [Aphis craccivora]